MKKFYAVPSTYHFMLKFSTRNGIGVVRRDPRMARQWLLIQDQQSDDSIPLEQLDSHKEMKGHGEPMERIISIPLKEDDPLKIVQIGSLLDQATKAKLISFLRDNVDVFAWSAADMPSIPMEVITHHLQADPSVKPVK